jgi:glycosyltransferase involved in cell wall biosynthesis
MSIGIISPHSLSLNNGSSVLSYNISQALSNKNMDVKLITIDVSSAIDEIKPNFLLYLYDERSRNTLLDPTKLYIMAMRDFEMISNIDVMHIIGNYNPFLVSFISHRLKKPALIHVHIRVHRSIAKVFSLLSLYRQLRINKVVATSINIARQINADDIILPPIDCHTFKPKRSINTINDASMLYLGPFQRFDILTMLKIMVILKRNFNVYSSLTMISRFSEDKELIPKILRLAAKFNLEGQVKAFVKILSLQEKINLLNESTFYVGLLKHNKNFPFVEPPISILEALSMGKPVISYDNIGLNSLPNDKSIIVLNSGAVNIKQAARIIADKINLLDQLSLSARKLALKNFSYEVISDKLIKIYNKLLNNLSD